MMIPVTGATLWVERTGNGSPAVLFIHGFPVDHTLWRHQLSALTAWTLIAPDLRGAGRSTVPAPPESYTTARYADDLAELLDALRISRVVACGLSMGGYVLFELLRRHARRVQAAIFCNTRAEADAPEGRGARDEMMALARAQGATAIADRMLPKLFAAGASPQVIAETRRTIARAPVDGIVGALHALRERPDHTASLPGIEIPVLVIAGADDAITPADGMRRMADAIPGSRFVRIEGAGHFTPLEQPDAVNREVTAFLESLA